MSAPEKSRTDKRSIRPKVRIGHLPGATVLLRGSEHQDQWRVDEDRAAFVHGWLRDQGMGNGDH